MADTTTTTYGLVKTENGTSDGTWGNKTNANWDVVDDLLDGTAEIKPDLKSGQWNIGGVPVTATAADLNTAPVKRFESSAGVFTIGPVEWAHGLGVVPMGFAVYAECTDVLGGYPAGARIQLATNDNQAVLADSTNITFTSQLGFAQLPLYNGAVGEVYAGNTYFNLIATAWA